MKIDRMMHIITILQKQEKVTAPQLAERLEVSRRTINRDIEDICKAGIPIVTAQGYGGGIYIDEGYKIEKAMLTKDELQAIFAGLSGIDSISVFGRHDILLEKLPKNSDAEMFSIDLASFYKEPVTKKIEALKQAIAQKRIVSFDYYYQKGEGRRKMEPYRLYFKWGGWYVFGFCLVRNAFRLFKLNRLWEMEVSNDTFIPREIPPEELERNGAFEREDIHLEAIFDKSQKYRLIEEYGPGCYREQSGGLLLLRDFANYDNMREWVMSFGSAVYVKEPQKLREECIASAQSLLKMYNDKK